MDDSLFAWAMDRGRLDRPSRPERLRRQHLARLERDPLADLRDLAHDVFAGVSRRSIPTAPRAAATLDPACCPA